MTAAAFPKPARRRSPYRPCDVCELRNCHRSHAGVACDCRQCERRAVKKAQPRRRISKAETRGAPSSKEAAVDRRKGKRASAQLRGGVRCAGDLSASGASLAFPRPQKKLGTKHSRRPRELGYMAFCKDRGCELDLDMDTQRLLVFRHLCEGPVQFAHLSDRRRYDVGDIGAGLCRDAAHQAIDGRVGGKARWFVALGKPGQRALCIHLANRARAAWDALSPEERALWEERAKAWRASAGRKREAA